jgi:hypothetical protein
MAGDLALKYRDFCHPDNSLDHCVLSKYYQCGGEITVKNKEKINFSNLEYRGTQTRFSA